MIKPLEDMTKEELIERARQLYNKIEDDQKIKQDLVYEVKDLKAANDKLTKSNNKLTKSNNRYKSSNKKLTEDKKELLHDTVVLREYMKVLENAVYSTQRKHLKHLSDNATISEILEIDEEFAKQFQDVINKVDEYIENNKISNKVKTKDGSNTLDTNDKTNNESEGETETITYIRTKNRKPKTEHIKYDHLETIEETVVVPEGFDICDKCGSKMSIKKYNVRKQLEYIPAKVILKIIKYPVYECTNCQENNIDGNSTYKALKSKNNPILKGSLVSPSLLAHIIDMKYLLGIPLYTQQVRFHTMQLELPRQNMVNWLIVASNYLKPLYEVMKQDLLQSDVIHIDETTTSVLNQEDSTGGYMWVLKSNQYDQPIIIYNYNQSRGKEVISNFIGDYDQYVVSDAYGVYSSLDNVTNSFCHVHAFRRYRDALTMLPKGIDKNKTVENKCYRLYQKVFEANKKIVEQSRKYAHNKDKQYKYIEEQRNKTVKPLYEKFLVYIKTEIEKPEIQAKPTLASAIKYTLNHEQQFLEVFNYGKLPLDNSSCERAIRPFALHRNRCKFYVSPTGANNGAIIYSIMLSAEANKLSGYMYMQHLLEQLPNIDSNNKEALRQLLPYNQDLPKYLRQLTNKEIREINRKIHNK